MEQHFSLQLGLAMHIFVWTRPLFDRSITSLPTAVISFSNPCKLIKQYYKDEKLRIYNIYKHTQQLPVSSQPDHFSLRALSLAVQQPSQSRDDSRETRAQHASSRHVSFTLQLSSTVVYIVFIALATCYQIQSPPRLQLYHMTRQMLIALWGGETENACMEVTYSHY